MTQAQETACEMSGTGGGRDAATQGGSAVKRVGRFRALAGMSGRGVLGVRAEGVRLASGGEAAPGGTVSFRMNRGGSFEGHARVGRYLIPLVTTTPVAEGEAVRLHLGRVYFFPESRSQ